MSISKKIFWSKFIIFFVSFVGFIGAIITIYSYFIQQRNTKLHYEIISNTNILDIKADASQFDILYDGKSLKATNENVRIISFRVINVGNTDILKTFYDDNDPLGFCITDGILLKKPEIYETSNQYLKDNLKIFSDSSNKVTFSNIILEPSEYFILKVIIKYNLETSPSIQPIGKIAGIKSIQVLNKEEIKETESFISIVFSGGILVQLVRGFGYTLILIFMVVIIIILIIAITEKINKKKRKKLVNYFKVDPKYSYNKMDDAIFNRFIEEDIAILNIMKINITSEKVLNLRYKYAIIKEKKERKYQDFAHRTDIKPIFYKRRIDKTLYIIGKMITDGLVIKEENKLKINNSMKKTLEQFISFLSENNYQNQDNFMTGEVDITDEVKKEKMI
ncbi:MAG TPA: hypothetical protein PLP19_19705 [bacterium]|nr:hypothetical protein [bacterium]HPN45722.1 hypothetical protein [bacterium]